MQSRVPQDIFVNYLLDIFSGSQNLNNIKEILFPIIMVVRKETNINRNSRLQDKYVAILIRENKELLRLPASVFLIETENLLKVINENDERITITQVEAYINRIYSNSLKYVSSDKTDIRIILHDRRTKVDSTMGFGIKSEFRDEFTLLNASEATNFTFKISETTSFDTEITQVSSKNPSCNKIVEREGAIMKKESRIEFEGVHNLVFNNNLILLDRDLPTILASLILEQLNSGVSELKDLVKIITESDPLNYSDKQPSLFYTYKIKHFLTSVALGMKPESVWHGKVNPNIIFLVVNNDSELKCYHLYCRTELEDYLFSNTYLKTSCPAIQDETSIVNDADNVLLFKFKLEIALN